MISIVIIYSFVGIRSPSPFLTVSLKFVDNYLNYADDREHKKTKTITSVADGGRYYKVQYYKTCNMS